MSSYLELVGLAWPLGVGGASLPLLTTAYVSLIVHWDSLWTNRQVGDVGQHEARWVQKWLFLTTGVSFCSLM